MSRSLLLTSTASNKWKRALIIFAILWMLSVYLLILVFNNNPGQTLDDFNLNANINTKRINQALQLLEQTKQRNDELKSLIDELVSEQLDKETAQKLIERFQNDINGAVADAGAGAGAVGVGVGAGAGAGAAASAGTIGANEISSIGGNNDNMNNDNFEYPEPSMEHELLRRRVRTNIGEIWNFFSSELGKIRKQLLPAKSGALPPAAVAAGAAASAAATSTISVAQIDRVLELGAEHKRSLLHDMDELRRHDGYESWRQRESAELSELVQRRLHYLQNPRDCASARILICKLNKGCGYGCQLHHLVYCFIMAYATERTMILKSHGWRYHKGGWDEVFQPVSNSCLNIVHKQAALNWPGTRETQVLILPIVDSLMPRPQYLPLAIPADLAPRLKRLHGDPIVWWVGQFLKYLLRLQPTLAKIIDSSMKKLGWAKPIVGIHVRRTDKVGTEAAFHSIEEYMTHVEDYYRTLEINGTTVTRRVYIASDDARVIEDARRTYTQYTFIGDPEIARTAAVSTRYTEDALNGIILDIHLLSLSDYLVCTFSSQVCRVAYEIMQTLHADAAHRFTSLDDIYYYGGQNPHNKRVVIAHDSPNVRNEMKMLLGDTVSVAGNHWDGYSKGKNTRTNQEALFPSFKVQDKIEIVQFPTYPQVTIETQRN